MGGKEGEGKGRRERGKGRREKGEGKRGRETKRMEGARQLGKWKGGGISWQNKMTARVFQP